MVKKDGMTYFHSNDCLIKCLRNVLRSECWLTMPHRIKCSRYTGILAWCLLSIQNQHNSEACQTMFCLRDVNIKCKTANEFIKKGNFCPSGRIFLSRRNRASERINCHKGRILQLSRKVGPKVKIYTRGNYFSWRRLLLLRSNVDCRWKNRPGGQLLPMKTTIIPEWKPKGQCCVCASECFTIAWILL